MSEIVYDEKLDEESVDHTGMRHIAVTMSLFLCGKARDPEKPIGQAPVEEFDCVVCCAEWMSLPSSAKRDIIMRLGGTVRG